MARLNRFSGGASEVGAGWPQGSRFNLGKSIIRCRGGSRGRLQVRAPSDLRRSSGVVGLKSCYLAVLAVKQLAVASAEFNGDVAPL